MGWIRNNRIAPLLLATAVTIVVVILTFLLLIDTVSAQGAGAAPAQPPVPKDKPKVVTQDDLGIIAKFGHWLGHMILSTAAMFTYVGGMLLDFSIRELILGMGAKINNEGLGISINRSWTILRDVANLAFIFGFIYIGIRTILDYESSTTKKMLASIIIGAILINFSLFITKFVIDASNLVAVEVHKAMIVGDRNLGESFAAQLGIVSMYKPADAKAFIDATSWGSVSFYILGAIFLMIAGFVFAAGALLIVVRFVALILIMVFSPFLFAASVFPETEKYAKLLWGKLFNYAFFAPAYLFLLLITHKLLEGLFLVGSNGTFDKNNFSDALLGKTDSFGVILNFVIATVFLIAALTIAKEMGVRGGEQAIKIGNSVRGKVQGALYNTTRFPDRWASRTVVGSASKKLLSKYDNWQAKNPEGGAQKFARFTVDKSVRDTLESGKKAKMGLSQTYQEAKDYKDTATKRARVDKAANEREETIKNVIKEGAVVSATERDTFVKAIKALTTEQLKDLDLKIITNEKVAVHLSTKQIEDIEKSGKYSDAEIQTIKDARKNGIIKIAQDDAVGGELIGGQTQREVLSQRGVDEIAKMPVEVFSAPAMAPHITPAMLEAKMRSGMSTRDMDAIRDSINNHINFENIRTGRPDNPYTKQWKNWSDRTTFGARLGLNV